MKIKSIVLSKWTRWAVSLSLLGALLWISDVEVLFDVILKADWFWLAAGFVAAMFLTAYGAVKWWVLMPRSRSSPLEFVRINFISNFVGIFFPGIVGIEAARIAGITRSSKDLPAAFASVLVDRLFGLLSLGTLVAAGGLAAGSIVPPPLTLACALLLAGLFGVSFMMMSNTARTLLSKIIPKKANLALIKLYECLDIYRDKKTVLMLSLLLSILFQVFRVIMVFFLTLSLQIDVDFSYLLVVVPVALFVQMLPISVYGIGIRESAMVTLLAVVGVTTENAIALSLLLLAVQIAGAFPGGILFATGQRLGVSAPKTTV